MDTVEVIYKDNCRIEIYPDHDPESPREWDNLGAMACWHRNYVLGDDHYFSTPEDFYEWQKDNKIIMLPLYLYDHSGITMYTDGDSRYFQHAAWDSGQVGFIYVTYEKIKKEYDWQIITQSRKEKIIQYLKNEVSVYDDYLTGNVYGYTVTCENCNEEIDSCWGFYGQNWKENGLLDQLIPIVINAMIKKNLHICNWHLLLSDTMSINDFILGILFTLGVQLVVLPLAYPYEYTRLIERIIKK